MTAPPSSNRVVLEGEPRSKNTPSNLTQSKAPTTSIEAPTTSIDQSPAQNHSASDRIHNIKTTVNEASRVISASVYQEKLKAQHDNLTLVELQCIEALFKAHLYVSGQRPKRPLRAHSLKDEMVRREALIAVRTAKIVANEMLIASLRKINRSVTCSWCQGDGCRSCGQTGKEVADGFRIGMLLNKNWKLQREQEFIAQHGTPNSKPAPFGQWQVGMWYTRSTSKRDENMSFLAEAQS